MSAQLINGKEVSQKRLEAVAEAVAKRQRDSLHTPCLAVVLVGGDPASATRKQPAKNAASKRCRTSCPKKRRRKNCWHWLTG